MSLFYGWDSLYKTIESSVTKKDDLLIALVHFVMTKYFEFKCIGNGDDKTLPEDKEDSGSELLPDNWNDDDNNYALRYIHNKHLYILLGLRTAGSLIITLINVKLSKVFSIGLVPDELVQQVESSLLNMLPTASKIADRCCYELLYPVLSAEGADPLRIGEPRRPPFGLHRFDPLGLGPSGNTGFARFKEWFSGMVCGMILWHLINKKLLFI